MHKIELKRGERPELMWTMGLTEAQNQEIDRAIGSEFHLRSLSKDANPWSGLERSEGPSAVWIPWRVWVGMPSVAKDDFRGVEGSQLILIQEEGDASLELEEVLAEGFLTVVREPLNRTKIRDVVFRAREVSSMYADIYRMTEEILLERELLARKTDQLLFLNKILASANESLDPSDILINAREHLGMILPVRQIHAVFWRCPEDSDSVDVEVFLNGKLEPVVEDSWVQHLMSIASDAAGRPVGGFQVVRMDPARRVEFSLPPDKGKSVSLPLMAGQNHFGQLVLLCDPDYRLGKDQVETVRSAVNHLALALRNALVFKEVKLRADHDGLTRIYNRHSFDERLVYEIKRRSRYNHELSLLMVDLDHFKQVNDTYGHLAGDAVLRSIGEILQGSLRTTDIAARYGGEEFVVLLPHTTEKDAWKLAERIRGRIAAKIFQSEGRKFSVTASIGVASVESGALSSDDDLVLKADKALYNAKHNGRNMVVVSGQETARSAVQNQ